MRVRIVLWMLLSAGAAFAGPENPNLLPFGELEGLRGNAGVAGGGSTGAVYYNPAALTEITHPRLAVSGSTYLQYHLASDSLAHYDNSDLPYSASAFNAIPSSVISTMAVGSWTVASFLLVPESLKLDNKVSWVTSSAQATFLQNNDHNDLWLGVAGGRALTDKLSIGFSLLGIRHSASDSATTVAVMTNTANSVAFSAFRGQTSVYGLAASVGLLYRASEWCSLGLRVRSPLLQITGTGSAYANVQSVNSGTLAGDEKSYDSLSAHYEMPFEAAAGARVRVADWWWWAADVSWQGGADYAATPEVAGTPNVMLRPMSRYNLGTEVRLGPDITASSGVLYNPSTVVPSGATANANYFGVTGGAVVNWERTRFTAGAFYIWAKESLASAPAELSAAIYGGIISVGYLL